jgi:hypothetical protein
MHNRRGREGPEPISTFAGAVRSLRRLDAVLAEQAHIGPARSLATAGRS